MRLLRSSAAAVALLATSVTVAFAQPSASTTQGYLKYVGATSGAPTAAGSATGPFRAQFGPTAATVTSDVFNVFCFDWLGKAQSSSVKLLTFSEAVTPVSNGITGAMQDKFEVTAATSGGLTMNKLNAAAWLSTQMTESNKSAWNEMHVALWNIFWDAGAGNPALPGLSFRGSSNELRAQHWYDLAMQNVSFDGSNFRVFVPTKQVNGECLTTERKRVNRKWTTVCTQYAQVEVFDKDKQMFFGQVKPEPNIQVPEPTSIALLSTGLVALAAAARRRRQNT